MFGGRAPSPSASLLSVLLVLVGLALSDRRRQGRKIWLGLIEGLVKMRVVDGADFEARGWRKLVPIVASD